MAAPRLIDSVAAATAHRDRDDLDAALARLLFDFIEPQRVTVWRVLDVAGEPRVQRRISLARGGDELGPEEVADPAELPRARDSLHWRECVMLQDVVHFESAGGSLHSLFPLRGESSVLGMVEIEAGAGLAPRQASLVHGILRIIRNYVLLLDYGERDTLTGLLNRKTFDSSFYKLRQRAARGDEPAWIGIADIDRFKSINDGYGHLFGDEVLLLVSRLMRENFRGADRLFRFGGEEFVIVLDRASEAGAAVAFDRLRAAVADYAFPQVGRVTLSLGYARVLPSDAPASAIERADAALYFAKQNGRNQIQDYDRLVAAGRLQRKTDRSEVELF